MDAGFLKSVFWCNFLFALQSFWIPHISIGIFDLFNFIHFYGIPVFEYY
jgi:hypothetical protein